MDEGPFVTSMLFGGTNDAGIGITVFSVTPPGCCGYATASGPNGEYIHSNFFDFALGDSGYLRLYDSNSANKTTLFSIGLVGYFDYGPAMWSPDHRSFDQRFSIVPTPEPSTFLLAGSVLSVALFRRGRRAWVR